MIKNDVLILRAVEPQDIDILYQWENNMEIWQAGNTLVPFSKYQLKKYIESSSLDLYQTKQLRLMIDLAAQNRSTIGMIDLFDFDPYHNRAGVGIMIHQSYRGKGYASSSLNLFIDYCFNHLGIHQLYCNIAVTNQASIELFTKNGFQKIGIRKEWLKTLKGWEDEALFQLIKGGN
ncbi:GNAT family N-acetyltransferase [Alkalitalea saponilacus]|uniref:Diamine N-acetyltransferase n=1 Tax=Alkalitalea saponilacus TaxID=889453 RepID=A0A1T5GT82_9BACT|nr:GNAT family N-acetyltransferase [Alkalitalea saponilacus]ASB48195.1 GNAT family N-acetyltransferase [Alkalitalea saponilacus]SKC11682.1 diamine N-acetyltransferase [Alkalitalea saponilacus]